jgi:putative sigma-54 modulation protein
MRLDITGRHVDITPELQRLIEKRLAKVERLLNDRVISATVVLTQEKYRRITELVIHAKADHILSGIGEGASWPLSMRKAAAKIESQAQKLKARWTDERHREKTGKRAAAASAPENPPAGRVVRATRYPVKPMSVDDAALRLDSGRDTFVVYRNADTDAVSILYRRKDGQLGLIEPD